MCNNKIYGKIDEKIAFRIHPLLNNLNSNMESFIEVNALTTFS